MICGFDATAAGLASAQSCWRMRKVKYAVAGITHSDFGSSSRIFALCSSIKAKAGEGTANFRMRNSEIRARNVGDDQVGASRFRYRQQNSITTVSKRGIGLLPHDRQTNREAAHEIRSPFNSPRYIRLQRLNLAPRGCWLNDSRRSKIVSEESRQHLRWLDRRGHAQSSGEVLSVVQRWS